MLIRISLIVAILAGLAVGVLNFTKIKEKVTTLQSNLKEQTEGRQKAEADARDTHKKLKSTEATLVTTKADLEKASSERDEAVAKREDAVKKLAKRDEELESTKKELQTASDTAARYKATGLSPEQIVAINGEVTDMRKTIVGIQAENKTFTQKIESLQTDLNRYKHPEWHVTLPAALTGKVLVSDPKWNFVVLDIGENQRVKEFGEMYVNRAGKLVAKVIVRNLQKDRSIANVMPGWEVGEILEGDQVIPAFPE